MILSVPGVPGDSSVPDGPTASSGKLPSDSEVAWDASMGVVPSSGSSVAVFVYRNIKKEYEWRDETRGGGGG